MEGPSALLWMCSRPYSQRLRSRHRFSAQHGRIVSQNARLAKCSNASSKCAYMAYLRFRTLRLDLGWRPLILASLRPALPADRGLGLCVLGCCWDSNLCAARRCQIVGLHFGPVDTQPKSACYRDLRAPRRRAAHHRRELHRGAALWWWSRVRLLRLC